MNKVLGLNFQTYCTRRYPNVVMQIVLGLYFKIGCIRRFPEIVMEMVLGVYFKILYAAIPRSRNENDAMSLF